MEELQTNETETRSQSSLPQTRLQPRSERPPEYRFYSTVAWPPLPPTWRSIPFFHATVVASLILRGF